MGTAAGLWRMWLLVPARQPGVPHRTGLFGRLFAGVWGGCGSAGMVMMVPVLVRCCSFTASAGGVTLYW
jgi:hypothetical protein